MKSMLVNRLIATSTVAGILLVSAPAFASSITLTGTIRDFKAGYDSSGNPLPGGHPDFERKSGRNGFSYGSDKDIVKDVIGGDKNPVFNRPTKSTTTAANFDQWYRDVSSMNQSKEYSIELRDDDRDGIYTFRDDSFFPIDNQMIGNQGRSHNYHFTYELHGEFTYKPGQKFKFIGDDDVWVFINGRKVIDLGGVHGAETQEVNLDNLNLTRGETYDLDFFFAERHTTESHFRIETSLAFEAD